MNWLASCISGVRCTRAMRCRGVKPISGRRVTRANWLPGESGNFWSSSIRMRSRPCLRLSASTAAQSSEGGRSVSRPLTVTRRNSSSAAIEYCIALGRALLPLSVLHVHLRVVAVRGRFRVTDVHCHAPAGEPRAERREAEHHVVRAAAVAHQAEAPDLALERAEPGADLQPELGKQRAAHLFLVHAFRALHRVHLRQPELLLDQELQA